MYVCGRQGLAASLHRGNGCCGECLALDIYVLAGSVELLIGFFFFVSCWGSSGPLIPGLCPLDMLGCWVKGGWDWLFIFL
jgi:hypothetical protein